jgi:hypothetical protein
MIKNIYKIPFPKTVFYEQFAEWAIRIGRRKDYVDEETYALCNKSIGVWHVCEAAIYDEDSVAFRIKFGV